MGKTEETKRKCHCTAIVLSAGRGKRMGTQVQKQYLEIDGYPIIYYTLKVFEESELIDDVILVAGKEDAGYVKTEIVRKYGFQKVRKVVEGGKERYDSVWNGLTEIWNRGETKQGDIIFIHDGARPFADGEILRRTYEEARKSGACVAGMPVKDTIRLVNERQEAKETPDRRKLWLVQTPQVFEAALIFEAYKRMMRIPHEDVTDDAMAVERMMNRPVKLVKGSYENIKITTPEDLEIAEVFAKRGKKNGVRKKL